MVCSPEQEKVGTGSIEAIICPVYSDLRIRATVSFLIKRLQNSSHLSITTYYRHRAYQKYKKGVSA